MDRTAQHQIEISNRNTSMCTLSTNNSTLITGNRSRCPSLCACSLQAQIAPLCLKLQTESWLASTNSTPMQQQTRLPGIPSASASQGERSLNFRFPLCASILGVVLNRRCITENFHRGLSVRVIGRLEPDLLDSNFFVELSQDSNQVVEAEISVDDETLYLMELSKVGVVESLISENSVNREEFARTKRDLSCNLFEISRGHCCCVGTQNIFMGFLWFPLVIVANTAEPTDLMDFFYLFKILLIFDFGLSGMRNEESVMGITCRMGLWLEECVEVPEARLNVAVSLHLFKSHLNEDFDELLLGFHKKVQIPIFDIESFGLGIEFLELHCLPRPTRYHGTGQLIHQLYLFLTVVLPPNHNERCLFLFLHQLATLQTFQVFLRETIDLPFSHEDQFLLIFIFEFLLRAIHFPIFERNYFFFHCISEPNFVVFLQILLNVFLRSALK